MSARLLQGALLVGVWLLVLGSAKPADVLLGAALAAAALLVPLPGQQIAGGGPPLGRRVVAFPRFAAAVLWDVARGTWDVALRVVHLRPVERPGLVEVPFGDRTDVGVAVSALATTLSPGTVLVDVDHERRVLVLHVIDATDPDGVRAEHERFYERAQRGVFP